MTEAEYKQKLSRFFGDLLFRYRIAESVKAQMDKYFASDFNLVKIAAPKEKTISRFIAILLEPNGAHGQGDVFLRKFVKILRTKVLEKVAKKLPDDKSEFKTASVEVEHYTDEGRWIDILLTLPSGFMIGIENKIWAGDQKDQLKDYGKYLTERGKDYLLIFLTCDGRDPSEWSIPKDDRDSLERDGKLITLSYRQLLLPWLEECLKECEADKVRWFIRDFISWIEENCREVSNEGQKGDN